MDLQDKKFRICYLHSRLYSHFVIDPFEPLPQFRPIHPIHLIMIVVILLLSFVGYSKGLGSYRCGEPPHCFHLLSNQLTVLIIFSLPDECPSETLSPPSPCFSLIFVPIYNELLSPHQQQRRLLAFNEDGFVIN